MKSAWAIALLVGALCMPACALCEPPTSVGVEATLVSIGDCIVAPKPLRVSPTVAGARGAIDDLATAAISQSVNYIGKALTAAGASKTWTATASRNFDKKDEMPSCVQLVRGNFSTDATTAGKWSAPSAWGEDLPTKLLGRGMALTRAPDFIFEGQIISSGDGTAFAIVPFIATYSKPIGTRFFRPGTDRNIALFFAITAGGTKANLDTAPAATIVLGKMTKGETRIYSALPGNISAYSSAWFLVTADSLKKPEVLSALSSETQGESQFMTFLGAVLSDPKASASVSTALTQALLPSAALAAENAKVAAGEDAATKADQAYAASIVALNACRISATDVPTTAGLAATARASLRTFMQLDAKAPQKRNTINDAVIQGVGGTTLQAINTSCADALVKLGP